MSLKQLIHDLLQLTCKNLFLKFGLLKLSLKRVFNEIVSISSDSSNLILKWSSSLLWRDPIFLLISLLVQKSNNNLFLNFVEESVEFAY